VAGSLAERALEAYLENNPHVKMARIGEPILVRLKILKISENQKWLDFLIMEHGLVHDTTDTKQTGHEFFHKISMIMLTTSSV
jgi:hypothetical protein